MKPGTQILSRASIRRALVGTLRSRPTASIVSPSMSTVPSTISSDEAAPCSAGGPMTTPASIAVLDIRIQFSAHRLPLPGVSPPSHFVLGRIDRDLGTSEQKGFRCRAIGLRQTCSTSLHVLLGYVRIVNEHGRVLRRHGFHADDREILGIYKDASAHQELVHH